MDTLIGLAAFLTQFQRFLWRVGVGVGALSSNHGAALAEAQEAAEGQRSAFCAT